MKIVHIVLIVILGVAALAVSYWYLSFGVWQEHFIDDRGKPTVSIVLTDQGFEPQYVQITKGTTVTFTTTRANQFWPASDPHPSHSIYPAFDPKKPVEPQASWSFIFDRPGNWGYHDHLRSYYTGRISVSP